MFVVEELEVEKNLVYQITVLSKATVKADSFFSSRFLSQCSML